MKLTIGNTEVYIGDSFDADDEIDIQVGECIMFLNRQELRLLISELTKPFNYIHP